MAEGMTDLEHEFKKMDLLADIRRRGVLKGLRMAEEIAVTRAEYMDAPTANSIVRAIRAEREKIEGQ